MKISNLLKEIKKKKILKKNKLRQIERKKKNKRSKIKL